MTFDELFNNLPSQLISDFNYLFSYDFGERFFAIAGEDGAHGNSFNRVFKKPEEFFNYEKKKLKVQYTEKDFKLFIQYLCYKMLVVIVLLELGICIDKVSFYRFHRFQYVLNSNQVFFDIMYDLPEYHIVLKFIFNLLSFEDFKSAYSLLDYEQLPIKSDLTIFLEDTFESKELINTSKAYKLEDLKATLIYNLVKQAEAQI